ncbi:unnamed protein product, partial [Protopolystoma xenopodis]
MPTTMPAKRLGKYQVNGLMLEITNNMADDTNLGIFHKPTSAFLKFPVWIPVFPTATSNDHVPATAGAAAEGPSLSSASEPGESPHSFLYHTSARPRVSELGPRTRLLLVQTSRLPEATSCASPADTEDCEALMAGSISFAGQEKHGPECATAQNEKSRFQ